MKPEIIAPRIIKRTNLLLVNSLKSLKILAKIVPHITERGATENIRYLSKAPLEKSNRMK